MITVVGLGVKKGDLTENGKRAIEEAVKNGKTVAVRTANTQSYESLVALGVPHVALDFVYEKSRSFATLNKNLAKEVASFGDGTVYCVDGSAAEDNSCRILKKRFKSKLTVIGGVSKVSAIAEKAGFESCSYTAVSAYDLAEKAAAGGLSLPLIVYDLDGRELAGDVKLALADLFGDETACKYISGNTVKKMPLFQLDRQKGYDYTSALAIDEIPLTEKTRFTTEDLKNIIVRLRKPDGCPWDKVQTPESIKMNVIEEAYELVDAIDQDDDDKIREETGDVMLQAVFHAVMKEETGAFNLTDVLSELCGKLIFRHSHIFGTDSAADEDGALSVWEANKMKEKKQETFGAAVMDVPKAFPAAMRAQKVGKRAAKAGMDFLTVEDATARIIEEVEEFKQAVAKKDGAGMRSELGDVLFAAVNAGRKAGCDAEQALKESVEKFAARFCLAERLALDEGKTVTELSPEEWDGYYVRAKRALNEKAGNGQC
ncbi:MAG: nucleoside triphosphate pyrophosphohydrolase [Clostridia bacterium]|nr:nucleoside triphosphate pyrophosphohydrolase [Clostridia bacterium]